MKILGYNFVAILLILMSWWMLYVGKPNWGWVLFAGLCTTVLPAESKKTKQ